MRKKMKRVATLLLLTPLLGCSANTNSSESITSDTKGQIIAELRKPTDVSELTEHKLEGQLIYYIGTSLQKPTTVSADRFDKITANMTIEQLVNVLGPGFSRNDAGVAFISWQCEDGRALQVFMDIKSLKQVPKIYKYKKDKDS
jgi:hypothetical protein